MNTTTAVTFQHLQQRFIAGLDRRLAHLNGCLAALRDVHAVEKSITVEEMMRGFHSLAGIGGTYGYPSITNVARRGEITCRSIGKRVNAADVDALAGVLTELIAAASAAGV